MGTEEKYVLGVPDKTLNSKYTTQRRDNEQWSTLVFPKEKPPQRDFALWRLALHQVVPMGGISDRLRRLTHDGYNIWDWKWDQDQSQLLHHNDNTMDIYKHSNLQ